VDDDVVLDDVDDAVDVAEAVVDGEDAGSVPTGVVVDETTVSSVVIVEASVVPAALAVPSYVAAARTPNPAEAAMPASVVPIVRLRSRRVADDLRARFRWVESCMTASSAGEPFGSMTRRRPSRRRRDLGVAWGLRQAYDADTPRSPRTGPVHVRLGG
jgi:hypothetical protein